MGLLRLIPSPAKRLARRMLAPPLSARLQVAVARQWLGAGDGMWCTCPDALPLGTVVYAAGVGFDVSFDLALIAHYRATVHAFDPTPRSIEWVARQSLPPRFHFHSVGVADYDGIARFHPPLDPQYVSCTMLDRPRTADRAFDVPVLRLATLMRQLGHDRIDLLKLDIEGAEYAVIDDLARTDIRPRQLLVEFHHRFPGVGVRATKRALRTLHRLGYRLFHVSATQMEFSFIRDANEEAMRWAA